MKNSVRNLKCSFCKKSEHEVDKLLAGPKKVFICDTCVAACNQILNSTDQQESAEAWLKNLEKPEDES